jgi:phosphatidate cytidylyltransferase
MVAIVDTAHPLAHADGRADASPADAASATTRRRAAALRLRVVSALVLAPIGLAAAWFGPPLLSLVVAVAAGLMAWEWARLCRVGDSGGGAVIAAIIAVVIAGVTAAALGLPGLALAIVVLGGIAVAVASRGGFEAALVACGIVWIAVPSIALIWLALDPRTGWATTVWLLAIVWATDIGAFAAGRTFGGPRLAPRISPNKTWSGLLGGIVCAAAVGAAAGLLLDSAYAVPLTLLSGGLAVVAQIGDLAESVAKRHFGVKDSSGLIPGHGGLLDRLDGMLAVIPAVALLSLCGGGSVLTWR